MTATQRLRERRDRHRQRHLVLRIAVMLGGFAALTGGVALLVLPGPGIPLLAIGLGLLALEFDWAERLLGQVLRRAEQVAPESRGRRIALGVGSLAFAASALVAVTIWGIPGL